MATFRLLLVAMPVAMAMLLLMTPSVLAKTAVQASAISPGLIQFRDAQFSEWKSGNVTYLSSTSYNAMGMAPLYRIANQVIELFVGEAVLPDGYLVFTETGVTTGPKVDENTWGDLLKHYWALLLVVFLSALLVVLMPIIGFCFCCCRCAGACGGRSQPFDKKHDTCRRVFLGLLLILLGTGMIFGVVIAFATNSYLHQGVEKATSSSRLAVQDTQLFLKTTSSEANHLLNQNYDELTTHLTTMLKETADVVIDQLEEKSKAVSLTQLAAFAEALPNIRRDMIRMQNITKLLQSSAAELDLNLRVVKVNLQDTLNECKVSACTDFIAQSDINNLNINGIDYNKLQNMTDMIEYLDFITLDQSLDAIKTSQLELEKIRTNLGKTIADDIDSVTVSIGNAGTSIRQISSDMTKTFERISDVAGNQTFDNFDLADSYIAEYSRYHLWAGLAVSGVLLLVLMCVVCGLMCGICGKRPDGYGDDCCNKGAGSRFLMCGVAIIFLTISVLTVCSVAYFLIGIVLRRGVCIPLQDPVDDQFFRIIDQRIDLNKLLYPNAQSRSAFKKQTTTTTRNDGLTPLRISQVIDSCHHNQSIYNVIRLSTFYDIEKLRDLPKEYGIEEQLNKLIGSIQLPPNLNIWSSQAQEQFELLATSNLNTFDLDKTLDNLNETITLQNLSEIAEKLNQTAEAIKNDPQLAQVRTSLKNQAILLQNYQFTLVDPMKANTVEMRDLAQNIDRTLKFNRTSFGVAMTELQEEVKAAEQYIQQNGTQFVQEVARELSQRFLNDINSYLTHVINRTQHDLGRCGPLSNVYNATVVASCNRIVDPLNGFWAGLSWCILLFLPTIIVSVKLSSLYQKSDPYPGPLVESEYLYDAYSERDNIPLANGPKNKRRNKKNERRRSSRDRRGDYYEDSSSPHGPPSGGSRDNRYNDMAPNAPTIPRIDNIRMFGPTLVVPMSEPPLPFDHRSEPYHNNNHKYYQHWNGGPPRYQNPPAPTSEYERPPPYYFPGAPSEGE